MSGYVYIQSRTPEHPLYTVGFYSPDGAWQPESDHHSAEQAAQRVAYLNGDDIAPDMLAALRECVEELEHVRRYGKSSNVVYTLELARAALAKAQGAQT